jgi:orotidine-5'-phosphate decarboxylase
MQINLADQLAEQIKQKKAPIVVGLDPVIEKIPDCYKKDKSDDYAGTAAAIYQFNVDIIDAVKDIVPVVKPQMAFYEMYGVAGIEAFEKTVQYAKQNDLIVIEDGKRNDIGNTAEAYANGHLGQVSNINTPAKSPFDVDFLTISPFLGPESLQPFVDVAIKNNKGLFVLVKTSNPGSGFIQDLKDENGRTVSQRLAEMVNEYAANSTGLSGYSPIGAVVGATYPEEASDLRKIMPKSIFLVPGYGAQGGAAKDIIPCFNEDGLGAVVSSSRGIIFAHTNNNCSREEYKAAVQAAVTKMQEEIYTTLKSTYKNMLY